MCSPPRRALLDKPPALRRQLRHLPRARLHLRTWTHRSSNTSKFKSPLAADDFDEAQNAVDDLLTIADETTSPLVRSVAAADDIETMRTRFKPLSEYLAAQELPQGYASAYCPMYDAAPTGSRQMVPSGIHTMGR